MTYILPVYYRCILLFYVSYIKPIRRA